MPQLIGKRHKTLFVEAREKYNDETIINRVYYMQKLKSAPVTRKRKENFNFRESIHGEKNQIRITGLSTVKMDQINFYRGPR